MNRSLLSASAAALLAVLLLALPSAALAEPEQLRQARNQFDYGKYEEAIRLVDQLLLNKLLATEVDLVEAWRIRGLSHLYMGRKDQARASLLELLLINPDYALDPLLVPPLAITELDSVRAENAGILEPIREGRRRALAEQKRLEEEARRRLVEEEERKRREEEERKLREREAQVVLQRVERHSFLTNLMPFGVSQLEQGRTQVGALLAIGQGLGIAGTVLTFSQVQSYIESDGKVKAENMKAARGWRTANWVVFGATAALYLGGLVDAVIHYEPETVSYMSVPRDAFDPTPLQPSGDAAGPRSKGPSAGLFLVPVEGGAAAGVAGRF